LTAIRTSGARGATRPRATTPLCRRRPSRLTRRPSPTPPPSNSRLLNTRFLRSPHGRTKRCVQIGAAGLAGLVAGSALTFVVTANGSTACPSDRPGVSQRGQFGQWESGPGSQVGPPAQAASSRTIRDRPAPSPRSQSG